MIDVHIRTIDRVGVNYIQETIESLEKDSTFSDYKIKVFDSGSEDLTFLNFLKKYKNIEIVETKKKLSALENFVRALKTDEDWVLVLGDDFQFCNNFFKNMEGIKKRITEDMRVVSFFLTYIEGLRERVFFELPTDKFWGGNFLIRKEDADSLISFMEEKIKEKETKFMDILLKWWHIETYPGKPIYMVAQGMCQHIGDCSVLNKDKPRRQGFTRQNFPYYDVLYL